MRFEPERAARVVLALLPCVGGDVVLEQAGVATLDRRRPRFLRAVRNKILDASRKQWILDSETSSHEEMLIIYQSDKLSNDSG